MTKNKFTKIFTKKILFSLCCLFLFFFNCKPEPNNTTSNNSSEAPQKFAPSDITLSKNNIDENKPVGTVVGDLTTVDKDSKTHTYSLDSADFEIVGNQLKSLKSFDFENKSSYDITISTKDSDDNIFLKKFTITINDIDEIAPTDIALSRNNINEINPIGAIIGALSSTDATPTDTHTYSLVAGAGADDNASFEIVGNNLKAKIVFDYENKSSYTIRIQTSDKIGNTFQKAFTITINDLDERGPTDIALSSSSINENAVSGTVVGNLSSTDATSGDSHTYSLVAGNGADDNANFEIDGNKLKNKTVFDFETKSSYKIRIKSTDSTSKSLEKAFTITINDMGIVFNSYAFNTGTKYIEASANDGSIDSSQFITVTISEDTFVGNINTPLTVNTHYTVANVPAGLTMVVTKLTATTAKITFTGKATSHVRNSIKDDSVNNVTITFKAAAFTIATDLSSVAGKSKNNIGIEYNFDKPSFRYEYTAGDSFVESGLSVGEIEEVYCLKVFIDNESFTGAHNTIYTTNTHFRAKNIPDGLTVEMRRQIISTIDIFGNTISTNFLAVYFTGTATSHASSDDVSNIEIEFLSAALSSSPDLSTVTSKKKSDIKIKFDDITYISIARGYGVITESLISESSSNNGKFPSVDNTVFIRNGTLTTSIADGSFFTDDNSYYTVTGMPAGLSLKIEKGNGKIRYSIGGQAANHAKSDGSYATVKFLPKMFQGNPSADDLYTTLILPFKFND